MNYVHLFQWNIPADNQTSGRTDRYINVIAEWNSDSFFSDGKPMCYTNPVNLTWFEVGLVKDWGTAIWQIKKIAENHFAELARMERINQARAILAVEENPILNRYEENNIGI